MWELLAGNRTAVLPRHALGKRIMGLVYVCLAYIQHTYMRSLTSSRGCSLAINITWQQHHNRFSSKSNFSLYQHFLGKWFSLQILWVVVFCCAKFHKNVFEEFQDISEFLQKGYTFCMNWRQDLMQTNLLLFGCFWKVFITHLFANDLYTLYKWLNASRLVWFWKTWKHVHQGKTQHWALLITVISDASFTKTVIKPKYVDRFSSKYFRAATDQCTIKSPNFMSILKTFKVI